MTKIMVFDPKKNKNIKAGEVLDKTYYRTVKNAHYMVKEKGYGIQKDILPKLLMEGVRDIILKTKTSNLKASLSTWLTRGNTKDYGHGEQLFLSTEYMEKVKI